MEKGKVKISYFILTIKLSAKKKKKKTPKAAFTKQFVGMLVYYC